MVQVRLLIKTSLLLVTLVYAEAQYQQDKQQRPRQQAEIYTNKVEAPKKFKFGDRKPTSLPRKLMNFRPEDSIAPYHYPESVEYQPNNPDNRSASQRFTQYEVPIVQKTRPNFSASNKGQRQQSHEKVHLPFVSSEEHNASDASKSKQLAMQHEMRMAAAVTPRNWSRNSHEERLNASSMKASSMARRQRKQYISSVPQRSGDLLTVRPQLKKNSATTTTSTTTTTTTTTTTSRPSFLQNNPFNIFSPEFWGFSNPTTTPRSTTRKPPKKYTPSPSPYQSSKEEKLLYQKQKLKTAPPIQPSTTTTTTSKNNLVPEGPFRIALPTFNFFNPEQQKKEDPEKEKEKRAIIASLREKYTCPRESEVRFQLFPKICKTDENCSVWNREELCCDIFGSKSCVSGVPKPLEESSHAPILGLIPRKCPSRPLAELWWEVKECEKDMDCWPRVCCPDGRRRYCRTSQPELETAPVPVKRSFDYLTEYLECTPPPPPIFDLHPKACTSTFDCFPNVCCQEAGLRHCRPPKKSVLTLMANFLNVDVVKRFAQNIVIK